MTDQKPTGPERDRVVETKSTVKTASKKDEERDEEFGVSSAFSEVRRARRSLITAAAEAVAEGITDSRRDRHGKKRRPRGLGVVAEAIASTAREYADRTENEEDEPQNIVEAIQDAIRLRTDLIGSVSKHIRENLRESETPSA